MKIQDFINGLLLKIDDEYCEFLKNKLIGEYIRFDYLSENEPISKEFLAEKINDYFEKVELKTDKAFSKLVEIYAGHLDTLVAYRIAVAPNAKKNEPIPPIPRARKYYERAKEIIDSRDITVRQLIDYTRLMMCLRQAIINSNYTEIKDFDYSSKCVTIDKFISSMRMQKDPSPLNIRKKELFDTSDLYSVDTCSFMITYILYYYIKCNEVEE